PRRHPGAGRSVQRRQQQPARQPDGTSSHGNGHHPPSQHAGHPEQQAEPLATSAVVVVLRWRVPVRDPPRPARPCEARPRDGPDTAAERAALDAGNKKLTDGCEARSARILPYVGTRIVAQDMDRVRAALGDSKLTYLGYSYGTAIGASYLDQFPTHVRAMVLD